MIAKEEEVGGNETVGVAEVRNVRQRYCMFAVTVACVIVTSVQLTVLIQRDRNMVELQQQMVELQQTVARLQLHQQPQLHTHQQHQLYTDQVLDEQTLNYLLSTLPYTSFHKGYGGDRSQAMGM